MTTPDAAAWRPTPLDVHAVLARREAFTETSRPSLVEVDTLVSRIVSEVAVEASGGVMPAALHELARTAVVYGAASLVEQSFTPEQSLGDDAPAAALYARYTALLTRLRTLLSALGLATVPDTATGGSGVTRFRLGSARTPSDYDLELRARFGGYVVTSPPDPYLAL